MHVCVRVCVCVCVCICEQRNITVTIVCSCAPPPPPPSAWHACPPVSGFVKHPEATGWSIITLCSPWTHVPPIQELPYTVSINKTSTHTHTHTLLPPCLPPSLPQCHPLITGALLTADLVREGPPESDSSFLMTSQHSKCSLTILSCIVGSDPLL